MFDITSSFPNKPYIQNIAHLNNFGTLANLGSSFSNSTSKIDHHIHKKENNIRKNEVPRFDNTDGARNDINGGHQFDVASF